MRKFAENSTKLEKKNEVRLRKIRKFLREWLGGYEEFMHQRYVCIFEEKFLREIKKKNLRGVLRKFAENSNKLEKKTRHVWGKFENF